MTFARLWQDVMLPVQCRQAIWENGTCYFLLHWFRDGIIVSWLRFRCICFQKIVHSHILFGYVNSYVTILSNILWRTTCSPSLLMFPFVPTFQHQKRMFQKYSSLNQLMTHCHHHLHSTCHPTNCALERLRNDQIELVSVPSRWQVYFLCDDHHRNFLFHRCCW